MAEHKILVTGATGLVGGNLTRLLVREKGERVRVLVRPTSRTLGIDDLDVERVEGDITDPPSLARAVKGCDRVYHAAAWVSMWNGRLAAMRKINVEGTAGVMQAAADAGVERVAYVSTVDTIGMRSRENPSDEQVPYAYGQYRNAYSLTKHEAHLKVQEFAARGLPVVTGCPTYMFGAWDIKPTSGRMILECKAGKTLLYPAGGNNFVDVVDVCHGLVACCEKGKAGETYILANGEGNLDYREIFTMIAEIVGGRKPIGPLPKPLALAGGYAADLMGKLTGKTMEINSASARMGYQPHYFTPRKAVEELGLPQNPVRDAIQRAYDWFRDHGYVR